jgi:PAS domain S-box-containing protein
VLSDPQAYSPENGDQHRGGPPDPSSGRQLMSRDTHPRPRALASLIDHLAKAASLNALIEMIPHHVSNYLKCHRVVLYETSDETLHVVSSTSAATTHGYTSTLLRVTSVEPIPLAENTPETRALRTHQVVVEPGSDELPMRIIAPLLGLGKPIGALVLIPPEGDAMWGSGGLPISQGALTALQDVARIVAIILEDMRLLHENRQRGNELSLLTRLTTSFNSVELDLDMAIFIVEAQVRRISQADLCAVALRHSQRAMPGRWLRPEIVKEVRGPLLFDDVASWQAAQYLPPDVRSFYAFPLLAEDHIVGTLALAFRAPHVLEESEHALLSILANTASTVLQKVQLHAEAERARQHASEMLERARNEERLKDAILQNIQSGIIAVDLNGRVTLMNQDAARTLHMDHEAAQGRLIEEVLPQIENGPHVIRQCLRQRITTQRHEMRVRTHDGHDLALLITFVPLRLHNGQDLGTLCAFQDLTPMRAMEDETRRVALLGTEANTISHDMIKIINGLWLGLQKLEPMIAGTTQGRVDFSHFHTAVNRMIALAENMLYLGKPHPPQPSLLDVTEVIESLLRGIISPFASIARVTIERHFEPNAIMQADKHQIERALQNLLINAIEAMPEGGTLTVRTRSVREPSRPLSPRDPRRPALPDPRLRLPSMPSGDETKLLLEDTRNAIEIEISDTGVGIPEDRLASIWEPYKTYGKEIKGNGLGLAITKQIIEAHGGKVGVVSTVGRGSTFTLRLPSGK